MTMFIGLNFSILLQKQLAFFVDHSIIPQTSPINRLHSSAGTICTPKDNNKTRQLDGTESDPFVTKTDEVLHDDNDDASKEYEALSSYFWLQQWKI